MKNMDTTNFFQNPTIENKKYIFNRWFTTGTNTTSSFKDKVELITLLCYLTQKMRKKDPTKMYDPLKVLEVIYKKDFTNAEQNGETSFYTGLAIICDDLLWGTNDDIPTPAGIQTGNDVVNKIKLLIEQWIPF